MEGLIPLIHKTILQNRTNGTASSSSSIRLPGPDHSSDTQRQMSNGVVLSFFIFTLLHCFFLFLCCSFIFQTPVPSAVAASSFMINAAQWDSGMSIMNSNSLGHIHVDKVWDWIEGSMLEEVSCAYNYGFSLLFFFIDQWSCVGRKGSPILVFSR